MAFDPQFASNGRVFLHYTRDNGQLQSRARRVHERRRRSDARPGERGDPAHGRPAVRQPQRRPPRLRPGRHAVHGARGRRLGRRPAGQRAEHAQPARQDPADRRLERHGLRNPDGQPLGRQCAVHDRRARRGMPGDPRLRPAQPLAIQLRRARRAISGSATSARATGRKSTASSRAATMAGDSARARTASTRRAAARPRTTATRSSIPTPNTTTASAAP